MIKKSRLLDTLSCAMLLLHTIAYCSAGKIVTIQKCCPSNEVIDVSIMKCRASGDKTWSPSFFADTDNEHGDEEEGQGIENYDIQSKIPKCPGTGVHIIPMRDLDAVGISAAKFRLLKSGRIVAKHANGHWITVPGNSCMDGLQNFEGSGDLYSGSETDQALITCPLLEEDLSLF